MNASTGNPYRPVIPEDCYRESKLSSYFDEKKGKDQKKEISDKEGKKDNFQTSREEEVKEK